MSDEQLITVTCCRCNSDFAMPQPLHIAAQNSANISFNCPYGHAQHFTKGETEVQKLRRDRNRLRQQAAQKDDEIEHERQNRIAAERSVSAHKGQITKLKKRVKAGVCPCCNRTFQNLARHMETNHSDMDPDEPLKVIEGGKQ